MKTRSKIRLRQLFAGLVLTMVIVVLSAVPAVTAEQLAISDMPLPKAIIPVVVLKGSDFDMGYQYAQQLIANFGAGYFQGMSSASFTDEQIKALKAYQHYYGKAFPEMIEFFKGEACGATAAGVPMDYVQALAREVGAWGLATYPGTEPPDSLKETLPPQLCAVWSAWGKTTKDGGLIGAASMDAPGWIQAYIIVGYPNTGNPFILGPNTVGINNKGVWMGATAGEGARPSDHQPGYDVLWSANKLGAGMHAIRFSNSANDALAFFKGWKWGSIDNHMFGDLAGNHYVIEGSSAFKAVRKAGDFGEDDFLTMRNNYFTAEGGKSNLGEQAGKFYSHGGWAQNPPAGMQEIGGAADVQMASVRVNQTLYNMLNQYRGKVDVDFFEMMWRYAGIMPNDPWSTQEFRSTKARAWETPGNLNNGPVTVCKPDAGDQGKIYVCMGNPGRVATPYMASPASQGVDWYQIGQTHNFYELTLAAYPAAVAAAANASAKYDIGRAYQKLMYKDYGDEGFEGLNALFDKANTEYYQGLNWTSKARTVAGNDQILCYAQAINAFTAAQCHAQRVTDALVKPPATPSDLGLKSYVSRSYDFGEDKR